MTISCMWEGPADLGEGPVWHAHEQALYWIDIAGCTVHRLDCLKQQHRMWLMPAVVGALVPCLEGGVIAAVGRSLVHIDEGQQTVLLTFPPFELPELRFNDAKCDRQGRLWLGVAHATLENPRGALYRVDPDGRITQHEQGITISNGLGFSPDDRTFYYTDGLRYRIYAYDFDAVRGELSHKRVFAELPEGGAEPDGLTVDALGYVWAAEWNAGRVVRYAPDGVVDRVVEMPVARPTSCIFGGEAYRTLYITSCSRGIGEEIRLASPAGGVFAYEPGVSGLPEPGFSLETISV